jgi:phage baseplate assembly protein gpV
MWINVKEKLPNDGETVLVSCQDGVKEAEFWAAGVRGNRGEYFFEAPYYGQDQSYRFPKVTHWQRLPGRAT